MVCQLIYLAMVIDDFKKARLGSTVTLFFSSKHTRHTHESISEQERLFNSKTLAFKETRERQRCKNVTKANMSNDNYVGSTGIWHAETGAESKRRLLYNKLLKTCHIYCKCVGAKCVPPVKLRAVSCGYLCCDFTLFHAE